MLKHKWWNNDMKENTTAVYKILQQSIHLFWSQRYILNFLGKEYVKLEADVAQWRMMDKDLAEFLFSKLEFKVYYFLFFANRAREKLWLTCPSIKIIGKLKKTQWAFLVLLLVLVAYIVISHIHKAQSR